MMTLLMLALLAPQDLWSSRKESSTRKGVRTSLRQLDLHLGPSIERSGPVKIGSIAVNLQALPDFACGQFDLDASFKSVFNKNAREELLGVVTDQAKASLAGSAMVLACQMSPTICDAIKHYRLTAQEALKLQLDQCQSLEQQAGGTGSKLRARALKDCLERRQSEGKTLDEAMRLCRDSDELRGLRGQAVREINLVKELRDALGLPKDAVKQLETFLNDLRLKPAGVEGRVRPATTDGRYEEVRKERIGALTQAVEDSQKGPLSRERLDGLVPKGTARMTQAELQRLASLEGPDRDIAIHSIASALALAQVVREAGDVLATLAAAKAMTGEEAIQDALDQESRRLEEEIRRLKEDFELERMVSESRLRSDGAAAGTILERSRRNTASSREKARESATKDATRPWGKGCPGK